MRLFEAIPDLRRRAFGRFGFAVDPFRWVALSSLCRLGDERAFEKLKSSLGSRYLPDRTLAAESLGTSGRPEALSILHPLVEKKHFIDEEVLQRAISRLESVLRTDEPTSVEKVLRDGADDRSMRFSETGK